MDRETRRANLKKLQKPATRKLRSNTATATMTLSEYFNTLESSSEAAGSPAEAPQQEQPSLESEQLFAEPRSKKSRDMELPKPLPKPKKAPKLKTSSQPRRGRGRSKQQPSISDFLRNEQLFAEVTAQHCMADNFSPDDIEMALALSKSEAQKYGRLRLQETDDEQEEVVNLLEKDEEQSTEDIRRKLQRYGFRTAAKEDYNMLAVAATPFGKRAKRCKWANKFTPLTLRNPAEQLKKMHNKVAALMAQQVRTKLPIDKEQSPFELISTQLRRLQASAERRITHEPSAESLTDLSAYYVEDLIEVSRSPANHLLKSWAAIQGRDLSPKRFSETQLRRHQQLEQVYAELEAYFGASAEQAELDELEKLVADNMIQETSHISTEEQLQLTVENAIEDKEEKPLELVLSPMKGSPLKEPPDKRARLMQLENEKELELNSDKENILPSTSDKLSLPTQSTRCISPDLFADSDDEAGDEATNTGSAMQNFSLKVYKDITTSDINTYEVYSSDEVKTLTETKAEEITTKAAIKENFVDLTQDSPEFTLETTSSKSLLETHVFPHSPIIEFDEDTDDILKDSSAQATVCEISEELYAKYAYKTAVEKADFELSSADEAPLNNNSFNLSNTSCSQSNPKTSFHLATTASLASKDNSLSFSHFDNTKIAFQRSFSLTQSPGQSAELKDSFKSPLSRKSNSFTEKSASLCTTPFVQSDASIDLTLDSDDDDADAEDKDGALLSDDEINYSIWKADKKCRDLQDDPPDSSSNESSFSSPLAKIKSVPHFKTEEELDAFLDASPATSNKSCNSRSPNKSALSKERAEFGILDAAISQPFTLSQQQSPAEAETSRVHIDWTEASFLETPPEAPLKRYSSSCTDKFKELLRNVSEPTDALDDFDRLVFPNTKETTIVADTVPSGLDRLLQGEINVDNLSQPVASAKSTSPGETEQLELNGQVYEVRACLSPKPDFVNYGEAELLQELYKYGIKPLKRKQAVKLLEYIYNQTHPIILPPEEQPAKPLPRSKSTPVTGKPNARLLHTISTDCLTPTEAQPQRKLKFNDASGTQLLRFSQALPPALCDEFEHYVLQTNVSKKTPQPLVPLHIAWHNLLCANPGLHESVLMFEPIDLQEIYMYLKQLGHRYEPKDLKCFFDRRCIIFRYELAPPAKQAQRHVRKPKSKKAGSKY